MLTQPTSRRNLAAGVDTVCCYLVEYRKCVGFFGACVGASRGCRGNRWCDLEVNVNSWHPTLGPDGDCPQPLQDVGCPQRIPRGERCGQRSLGLPQCCGAPLASEIAISSAIWGRKQRPFTYTLSTVKTRQLSRYARTRGLGSSLV